MGENEPINVVGLNHSANHGIFGDDAEMHRQILLDVAVELEDRIRSRAEEWEEVGLSEQEARVAAYREFGFVNNAIRVFMGLSINTVNEYHRRIKKKYQKARGLVNRVEKGGNYSLILSRTLTCPYCGHGNVKAKKNSKILIGDNKLKSSCWECFENFEFSL